MLDPVTIHKRRFILAKALTKPAFGVPSAELVNRIESSDMAPAARAAGYRFEAKLGELDRQYFRNWLL